MNQVFFHSCEAMPELGDRSVQTCVTSPPYFGLRDYGTASWSGGDSDCEHTGSDRYYTEKTAAVSSAEAWSEAGPANAARLKMGRWREKGTCTKCGAVRVDEQIGLEPTLDAYVERLVGVFREVRRVLRDDGTLWLNLGDAYNAARDGGHAGGKSTAIQQVDERYAQRSGANVAGLKPKDLIGVPWAVAFALRADGWWLRSDIVWQKVPPMPSSVEDRCTSSHEYIFMLAKSRRYFFDQEAVREPIREAAENTPGVNSRFFIDRDPQHKSESEVERKARRRTKQDEMGRTTAGFNERWNERIRNLGGRNDGYTAIHGYQADGLKGANRRDVWAITPAGYPGSHFATFPPEIPSLCIRAGSKPGDLVLDPFAGSGTTLEVAEGLGRAWVGYELNEGYRPLIEARLTQRSLWSTHE